MSHVRLILLGGMVIAGTFVGGVQYLAVARQSALKLELQAIRDAAEDRRVRAQEEDARLRSEAAKRDAAGVRLTDIDQFPTEEQEMVRAVIAALGPSDAKPENYMAIIESQQDGIHFDLRYEFDPTDYTRKGDQCGKCRDAVFDPRTNTVRIRDCR